jgi:hypothetical protein
VLIHIFNLIFVSSEFPEKRKTSVVLPIPFFCSFQHLFHQYSKITRVVTIFSKTFLIDRQSLFSQSLFFKYLKIDFCKKVAVSKEMSILLTFMLKKKFCVTIKTFIAILCHKIEKKQRNQTIAINVLKNMILSIGNN